MSEALMGPPRIAVRAWVHASAVVVGDVVLQDDVSVWPTAVIRGDRDRITIGEASNVQDGAVLHADPGMPCTIGARVTIGHRAVVHGATVEDDALIGIGAIVLNGAVVGAGAVSPPSLEQPTKSPQSPQTLRHPTQHWTAGPSPFCLRVLPGVCFFSGSV